MDMRKFLGFGPHDDSAEAAPPPVPSGPSDTATVRKIINQLGELPPDVRRYLAGLSYVLSRAAHSDLDFTEDETRAMEKVLIEVGNLPEAEAVLVVEIAKNQADLYSGTEDFLVTREFAGRATDEQKRAAVEACFAVVATDHEITSTEYAELTEIADELDLSRADLNVIRNKYKDDLTAIKQMRGMPSTES